MKPLRMILPLAALLVLAACRMLPLPYEFDLRAQFAEDAIGEVETPIVAGFSQSFTLDLPAEGERCHELDHGQSGVTIVYGQLRYQLDASYRGPELSGVVEIQPFLAASEGALWQDASALGEPLTVDVGASAATVSERLPLNRAQIDALNDGHACLGLRLSGADLSAEEDGDAVIAYEVRQLVLRVGFALF
jgi:hypothetical protein